MANNTTLPGTGEVYASDAITESGVEVNYQVVKIATGPPGTAVHSTGTVPLAVADSNLEFAMQALVLEMRLMNMHLEQLTKLEVSVSDFED